MDSNNLVIISDPRLGPVEEFNILNPKMRRKKLKSNYIQNNITSIIILISLIFTFLALSDIIPIFDNFQSEYRQTNKNKVHHIQENKESKTKPSSSNNIAPSTQPNLSSDSTELKNKDKDLNTNSIAESSTNATQSCNGNIGLNQNYAKIDANDSNYTYIPIVGIDDIHGNFFPKVNNIILDDGKSITYKTGGLEYVTKYINILRHDFGSNRVLFFDGGDFYQGGIDSVLFDGEILLDYYNLIGINGSTIGNHEFDYSKSWIEHKINNSNHKTLINNIMDNTTNNKEGALGKNHETSHLYDIKLDNGDMIKIGVIGLSFNMKNDKKLPNTWGNRDSWDNITFFSYMEGLEEESKKLRDKGASAIILLTHFGLVCNQTEALKLDMYNKSSPQSICYRDDEDSVLYKLLDNLPSGVIDGIIGGDTHMSMHHWEKNIPMMSTPTHARYINIMYLPFKKDDNGKYILDNDQIKIEGPLPACEKIFKNYQNCEIIAAKEYEQAGELINFSWRGVQIEKDPMVKPIYDKYYDKFKEFAAQDIVTFKGFDKIKVDKSGDCTLCNTYLDAIVDIKGVDFAIINRGIFPEELVPGTISRAEFYNQMPYLDRICTINVTGDELKKIVSTVQSKGKGFYPSSRLKQTVTINNRTGEKNVTNIEIYVNDEPVPIVDTQTYKMASSLFVLSETSGEDFAKSPSFEVIHKKAHDKEVRCSNTTIDDEMSQFFKGKGTIDLSNKVDPKRPRIVKIFE
jgi:2',3'-cyclic-nucleotide 2'-phosphodiesterase (5'-nucleotidase family)